MLCWRIAGTGTVISDPRRSLYRVSAHGPSRAAGSRRKNATNYPQALIYSHRTLGGVVAGQAPILLAVATPHSAETCAVSQKLLRRLKTEVPLWKEPIAAPDHS
jgi:molybdopterin synthase catalytic subunit